METLWFGLVAFMLTMYVVLDGFDLGAGAVHLFVAKTDEERRAVIRSIGSVWDGNEVWLIAAGGTLYFAFPVLYAASFSGLYLPLTIVLWLLILRGIAIEFRSHIESEIWRPFWDTTFALASALLAVFFGAALGNVVRGVPLDDGGRFFEPLWTNLQPTGNTGILDWFTVVVGLTALAALAMHGALWVALKTHDPVLGRARRAAGAAWYATLALTAATTILALRLQPQIMTNLRDHPWGFIFPGLALGGLGAVRLFGTRRDELKAFLASCAYLIGMMTSAAFGLYPNVLPSSTNPDLALTVQNTATAAYGLRVGIVWWTFGMLLVAGYFVFVYRRFAGKVALDGEGH